MQNIVLWRAEHIIVMFYFAQVWKSFTVLSLIADEAITHKNYEDQFQGAMIFHIYSPNYIKIFEINKYTEYTE